MALWVKAGSIIPILAHKKELSLLRAIVNPISLLIFSTTEGSSSTG
jgi:hypothetical protein